MYTQVMASFCRVGLLLALVLVPLQLEAPAQAAESEAVPSDSDAMRLHMHRYFDGEKTGGIWLMSVGAPAAVTGSLTISVMTRPGAMKSAVTRKTCCQGR